MSIEGLASSSVVTVVVTNGIPVATQTGPQPLPNGTYKIVVSTQHDELVQGIAGGTAPRGSIVMTCLSPRGAIESTTGFFPSIKQLGGIQVVVTAGSPVATQLGPTNLKDGSYTIQEMLTNSGIQLLCSTPVYGEIADWLDL